MKSTIAHLVTENSAKDSILNGSLLIGAIFFNFALCLVNGHLLALGASHVIFMELIILATSFFVAVGHWNSDMTRWLLYLFTSLVLFMIASLARASIQPKDFRDILIIAIFTLLGLCSTTSNARSLSLASHSVIVGVSIIEVSFPDIFGQFLKASEYYINTRGFDEEKFLKEGSGLFNSVRPDDRYLLPALGWIRSSSVFLEPVGFGNYCTIATLCTLYFWSDFSKRIRTFLTVSLVYAHIASDGRFAAAASIALALISPIVCRTPIRYAHVYLPAFFLISLILSLAFKLNPLEDSFPGRIARGIKHITKMDLDALSGFTLASERLAGSGLAYFLTSQSLIGVILLQITPCSFRNTDQSARERLMFHGGAFLLATSLMVSNSMFSIKTACLLWFMTGMASKDSVKSDSQRQFPGHVLPVKH